MSRRLRKHINNKWEDVRVECPGILDLEIASMRCPTCNRWCNKVYTYGDPTEFVNYCPYCGANMKGDT